MTDEKPYIERLELRGYKSIRDATVDFAKLNVLIGANGAGKSNLFSFFSLLQAVLDARLDDYAGRHGGPQALLFLGPKITNDIIASVTVSGDTWRVPFRQRLAFRPPDALFSLAVQPGFDEKDAIFLDHGSTIGKGEGRGHHGDAILSTLKDRLAVYHFDDTSLKGPLRTTTSVEDNKRLSGDGANLPAMLYLYKQRNPTVYDRIVRTIKKIMPQFEDFVLEPRRLDPSRILLNWRQKGSDYLFGPHQFSDGSLRAIALLTVLLQPESDLPDVIVIDEPELGQHPRAIEIIAGLIRSVSVRAQLIVATQSQTFLNYFEAPEIITVEAHGGESSFRRLDAEKLKDWLEDYSIGELWQRNVLGGGPLP